MGKGEDWKDSETECLIAVWRDPHLQQTLNNSKRNIHVYQQISETLNKVYGIDRSGESCRSKVKNMKSWYKREKDKRSLLGTGSEHCKENTFFKLMEEVLFGDLSSSSTRPLFPTNLFSNLNKHSDAFSSGKDDFEIKTEMISNSESEQDSLDISNDKDETFYSDNGERKAPVENSSQGETTLSDVEKRESIPVNEEDHHFCSKTIPLTPGMEISRSSKVNDIDMEISSSLNDNQSKMFCSTQNNKCKQNFQTRPEKLPNILGRCRQVNNVGVRNKIVGTNNFYTNLRKQARKMFVTRGSHPYLSNQKKCDDRLNSIRQLESKSSDFELGQLCESTRGNHMESSERIQVAKETHPNASDHEKTLTAIANKLTELADKLIESERQHLLVRQKEADVELQRQDNEKQRIAIEKQRIAMEETQRREDREHHYRVMQLVLGRNGPMANTNSLSSVLSDTKTESSVVNAV